jgi:hypothetical protein
MEQADNRRGKVTAENIEEARRLKEIFDSKRAELEQRGFGTQAAFGHEYDIGNQSAVGFFLNGQTALSLKAARGFAIGLGVKISEFSPRLAKQAAELGQLAGASATRSSPRPERRVDLGAAFGKPGVSSQKKGQK